MLLVSQVSFTTEPVVRGNGAPQRWVRSFESPRRASSGCTLTVDNGDGPATRITNGAILLNG